MGGANPGKDVIVRRGDLAEQVDEYRVGIFYFFKIRRKANDVGRERLDQNCTEH